MNIFKKNLGQNFLIDKNIKNKILNSINIKNTDIIIEIGAGEGSISSDISSLSKKSYFIELDGNFIKKLENSVDKCKSSIHNDDILKFNIKDIIKKHKNIRIIGNLPYKISTKIIIMLTEFQKNIKDLHFLVQKEMAERIISKKNNQNKISIKMQYFFEIEKLYDVKPNSFYPIPKITSSFIKLKPKQKKNEITDFNLFNKILTNAFNNQRKKIKKSIKEIKNENIIINNDLRPQNLSIEEFLKIYNHIKKKEECK
ncbi:MAG TPA: 16S rRNA (adenine(1518)-N(6)/adenine(1519)-N(6))-dimethyltransferase RsmA [Candidatus Azoamicus sp.]